MSPTLPLIDAVEGIALATRKVGGRQLAHSVVHDSDQLILNTYTRHLKYIYFVFI